MFKVLPIYHKVGLGSMWNLLVKSCTRSLNSERSPLVGATKPSGSFVDAIRREVTGERNVERPTRRIAFVKRRCMAGDDISSENLEVYDNVQ